MVIHLEIDWPEAEPRTVSINASPLVGIGRDARCTLRLPHPTVSRRHAELRADADTVFVRDLGSSSGTFVHESRVTAEWLQVPIGTNVWLGDIRLRVLAVGTDDPDASMTLLLTTISRRPHSLSANNPTEPEPTPAPPCRLHLQGSDDAAALTLQGPYPTQIGPERFDASKWPDLANELPIDVFESLTGSLGIVSASGFLLTEHDPPRQLGTTHIWLERAETPLLESIIAPRELVRGVVLGTATSGPFEPTETKVTQGDVDAQGTPRQRPGHETQAPVVVREASPPAKQATTSESVSESPDNVEIGIIEGLRADPIGRAILGVALMVLLLGILLMFFVL